MIMCEQEPQVKNIFQHRRILNYEYELHGQKNVANCHIWSTNIKTFNIQTQAKRIRRNVNNHESVRKCYIEMAILSPQLSLLCQLREQRSYFVNMRVFVHSLSLNVPFEYWLFEYAPFD